MVTWRLTFFVYQLWFKGSPFLPPYILWIPPKSNLWIHHLSDPNTDQCIRVHRSDHYLILPSLIVGLMTSCYWYYFEFKAPFFDRGNPQYPKSPSFQGPLLWSWHTLLTSFYDCGTLFFSSILRIPSSLTISKTLPYKRLHKRESTTTYYINSYDNYT
jgi:hypothetical protein